MIRIWHVDETDRGQTVNIMAVMPRLVKRLLLVKHIHSPKSANLGVVNSRCDFLALYTQTLNAKFMPEKVLEVRE